MRVRLGERRQQQVAIQIDDVFAMLGRQRSSNGIDGVQAKAEIDDSSIGKRGRAQQHG
jgi:hypothetical protein